MIKNLKPPNEFRRKEAGLTGQQCEFNIKTMSMKKMWRDFSRATVWVSILWFPLNAMAQPLAGQTKDAVVDVSNWLNPPNIQWAFRNMENVSTTTVISRQGLAAKPLEEREVDFSAFRFDAKAGDTTQIMDIGTYLEKTHTDAFVVLHEGQLVLEKYFQGMNPYNRHMMMSVSKSFTGTMVAMLIREGKIDSGASLSRYIPELEGTHPGESSVQDLLDMRAGLAFSEVYADPESEIWVYGRASGLMERPQPYQGPHTVREYIAGMKRDAPTGDVFLYATPVADILAWLVSSVTDKTLAESLSDRFWSKLGMETDALILTDPGNVALGGSGLLASPRDIARFGKMMAQNGLYNGIQVVHSEIIDETTRGAERFDDERFVTTRGFSYKNQWWVTHNPNNAFYAVGIHGQYLYIDPTAGVVIVKQSSSPDASPAFENTNRFRFFDAIVNYVAQP